MNGWSTRKAALLEPGLFFKIFALCMFACYFCMIFKMNLLNNNNEQRLKRPWRQVLCLPDETWSWLQHLAQFKMFRVAKYSPKVAHDERPAVSEIHNVSQCDCCNDPHKPSNRHAAWNHMIDVNLVANIHNKHLGSRQMKKASFRPADWTHQMFCGTQVS